MSGHEFNMTAVMLAPELTTGGSRALLLTVAAAAAGWVSRYTVESLTGGKDYDTRTRLMQEFGAGKVKFMIVTDVLCRGCAYSWVLCGSCFVRRV